MTQRLVAAQITVGYGSRAVLDGLDLGIEDASFTALVGPNGSGKSTLLRSLGRLLRPRHGTVLLDGRSLAERSTAEIARELAVLPQAPPTPAALTVRQLVAHGRYAHLGPLRRSGQTDHEAVEDALRTAGLLELAERDVDSLSGGERQRAWVALTLAQRAPVLLLDEPTTFLDVGHQFEVLELLSDLRSRTGMTVVVVLHDLNQAARFADRLVVLHAGRIVADGPPAHVLDEALLAEVFGVTAQLISDPRSGRPVCLWSGAAKRRGDVIEPSDVAAPTAATGGGTEAAR
jgi:iron complex transport system ATP-binding protein